VRIAVLTTDSREHFREYGNAIPYFGTAPEALLQGFKGMPEIEIHVISCAQQPMRSPEKLADNIWFHGLHVPKTGWMRTFYQGCVRTTRKKLRELQPDIVHGQGTERDCAISAIRSGFPNVITVHGNMNAIAALHHSRVGSFQWLAARVEDFTLQRAGGIICISDYVKDLVARYKVPTWIVPNAIQEMFFDFPRPGVVPAVKPLLINVGVISERKRQQALLAVLESLRNEGLSFDTAFVGHSSPQLPYSVEFSRRLATARAKYGGFEHIQRLDEVSFCQLYDRASAMIHFSNEESFGLTFAEAIARGLYLFASDVGAIRDIAKGVEGVEVIGMDNWTNLKEAVRQWLVGGQYRKPRPSSPPAEFIERYHPVSVARRHLEIYREVLSSRS
jgi:glycosyltransferase involved in cell wall biosynthesis